jgi:hypothetical protein
LTSRPRHSTQMSSTPISYIFNRSPSESHIAVCPKCTRKMPTTNRRCLFPRLRRSYDSFRQLFLSSRDERLVYHAVFAHPPLPPPSPPILPQPSPPPSTPPSPPLINLFEPSSDIFNTPTFTLPLELNDDTAPYSWLLQRCDSLNNHTSLCSHPVGLSSQDINHVVEFDELFTTTPDFSKGSALPEVRLAALVSLLFRVYIRSLNVAFGLYEDPCTVFYFLGEQQHDRFITAVRRYAPLAKPHQFTELLQTTSFTIEKHGRLYMVADLCEHLSDVDYCALMVNLADNRRESLDSAIVFSPHRIVSQHLKFSLVECHDPLTQINRLLLNRHLRNDCKVFDLHESTGLTFVQCYDPLTQTEQMELQRIPNGNYGVFGPGADTQCLWRPSVNDNRDTKERDMQCGHMILTAMAKPDCFNRFIDSCTTEQVQRFAQCLHLYTSLDSHPRLAKDQELGQLLQTLRQALLTPRQKQKHLGRYTNAGLVALFLYHCSINCCCF